MKAELSDVLCYLVSGKGNSFYARILSALQMEESKIIPYMAVILRDRFISLAYNIKWMQEADFDEVVSVVEHEALHVVLEHLPRKLTASTLYTNDEEKTRFFRTTPFAEDMADNCLLEESNEWVHAHRHKGWVFPDLEPFNLPKGQTYEWYLNELMKRDKEDKKFSDFLRAHGPQSTTYVLLPNHKIWEDIMRGMSDEEKMGMSSEIEQRIKEAVRRAVDEHNRSRGTVPAFLQELINKLLAPPRVPWTQLLRDRVVNTKRWKWQRSISRPNRRHVGMPGLCPFPGRRKDRTFTVVFGIDTSGSMGAPQLELALSELQHLQKTDREIEITVLECDADIGREYKLRFNDEIQYELTGRGGTTFDPVLIRSKALKPDIVFYYTDGYAPPPEKQNRVACPFVWLIAPYGKNPDPDWGYELKMEDQ